MSHPHGMTQHTKQTRMGVLYDDFEIQRMDKDTAKNTLLEKDYWASHPQRSQWSCNMDGKYDGYSIERMILKFEEAERQILKEREALQQMVKQKHAWQDACIEIRDQLEHNKHITPTEINEIIRRCREFYGVLPAP